jgi:hypothetical protein
MKPLRLLLFIVVAALAYWYFSRSPQRLNVDPHAGDVIEKARGR